MIDATAYDTEAALIRPGVEAPPVVCLSLADAKRVELYATDDIDAAAAGILKGEVVGHNLAFDHACLMTWHGPALGDLIMDSLEHGRSYCTWVAERLIEISAPETRKTLKLEVLCNKYGIKAPPKDDGTRLSYGPLYGKPLSAYSEAQIFYAKEDALVTRKVALRQYRYIERGAFGLADLANMTRRQVVFQLIRNYGLRTDSTKIDQLQREVLKELARMEVFAKTPMALTKDEAIEIERLENEYDRILSTGQTGFPTRYQYDRALKAVIRQLDCYRLVKQAGTKNMVRLRKVVEFAYDGSPPMTEPPPDWEKKQRERREAHLKNIREGKAKGDAKRVARGERALAKMGPFKPNISTASEVLEESNDPNLVQLKEYGEWLSVKNKDLPLLLSGSNTPICPRYGMADTTRSTQSSPNLQNIRRKEGIRECFIPREGYAFVATDHASLELYTVAQVIVDTLGRKQLADQLNSGLDLHCIVASSILGKPYEWCVEHKDDEAYDARQSGKAANYGLFGGLGNPTTFVRYGRLMGVNIEDPEAIIAAWRVAVPDGAAYLDMIKRLPQSANGFDVPIPGTTIVRRGARFCAAANTPFQSLGAQVEADVLWAITKATRDPKSPLFGSIPCHHIHDENVLEIPVDRVHEGAMEARRLMREVPKRLMPYMNIDASVVAMAYWSKKAKTIYNEKGELQVWAG